MKIVSDSILYVTSSSFSNWLDMNWFVTGHQSGAVEVWQMVYATNLKSLQQKSTSNEMGGLNINDKAPEYKFGEMGMCYVSCKLLCIEKDYSHDTL
ncbi:hypothetical protein FF1_022297 [Malus domestica]